MSIGYTETKYGNVWWDGMLQVSNMSQLEYALLNIDIDNITITDDLQNHPDVILLNFLTEGVKVKNELNIIEPRITIKSNFDLDDYHDDRPLYQKRLEQEKQYIIDNDMMDLFRIVHHIIEVFKSNNIVWGVGRGSSCASLLLYMMDVHLVDPIKYNICMTEFFKRK